MSRAKPTKHTKKTPAEQKAEARGFFMGIHDHEHRVIAVYTRLHGQDGLEAFLTAVLNEPVPKDLWTYDSFELDAMPSDPPSTL